MSDIHSIGPQAVNPVNLQYSANGTAKQAVPAGVRREADTVEISDTARHLARARSESPVREDLVERIRSEIMGGRYDSTARFEAAFGAFEEDILRVEETIFGSNPGEDE